MSFSRLISLGFAFLTAVAAGIATTFAVGARADDKDFKPIIEAEMPAGFPGYTPVGDVRVKQYPAYRKAETNADEGGAFWKLFSHIKGNKIAMTAPVEMGYAENKASRPRTMAFLYGRSDLGTAGQRDKVQVLDVSPMMVVSTGVRGARTTKSVAQARERLDAWLETNQSRYTANGEMRVMAYNSPFVPRNRNYFEVEIPIQPRDAAEAID